MDMDGLPNAFVKIILYLSSIQQIFPHR
jgi:hypothetical protein